MYKYEAIAARDTEDTRQAMRVHMFHMRLTLMNALEASPAGTEITAHTLKGVR